MRYLHTMVRVVDLDKSLAFYCDLLGLKEIRRIENKMGRFTLVFLAAPEDAERAAASQAPMVELTYNWDPEDYQGGRNFGHLAYHVDDIYESCQRLMEGGVTINRPPRDGHMAFVRSPDGVSHRTAAGRRIESPCRTLGVDAEHGRVVGLRLRAANHL